MNGERIVAVALLTEANFRMFGDRLKKVYPIEDSLAFRDLLLAIDEADRERWSEQDRLKALRALRSGGDA